VAGTAPDYFLMNSSNIFRSLYHRNYRLFFLGQLVSLHGTWMQSVAQSLLVYSLTDSGFMLGLTGTVTLLPSLLFGLYGGLLADRFNRKKLLITVQSMAMIQAFLLGTLTLLGWISAWQIIGLAFLLGLIQAMEMPVRQSFVAQLVPREILHNAIGLNSSMFHVSRFGGPAIAGFLVAWIGEGPVFILNAFSFLAVIISMWFIDVPLTSARPGGVKIDRDLWAGVRFARGHAVVRLALIIVALTSIFGGATAVLLPIYASQVFQGGPENLGWLMAMLGVGSLLGALSLARRQTTEDLEKRIAIAGIAVAVGLMVFARNELYLVALLILPFIGFAVTSVYASSNTLIQFAVPDHLRGRIMALYSVCLHGMVSIGQLVLGSMADLLGAPMSVVISAAVLLISAGVVGNALRHAAVKSRASEESVSKN
jgi:MFS family permease